MGLQTSSEETLREEETGNPVAPGIAVDQPVFQKDHSGLQI